MARVYISFNAQAEKEDYEVALKAYDYKFALEELDEFLRNKLKYDGDLAVAKQKVYQEVRDKLHEIMSERDI